MEDAMKSFVDELAEADAPAPIDPNAIAYAAYLADKPNAQGMHYRIVGARASGGWTPLKEAGDPDPETGELRDPLYLPKGPIWFGSYSAASEEAERRNTNELHLTPREAARIVGASMTGGVR